MKLRFEKYKHSIKFLVLLILTLSRVVARAGESGELKTIQNCIQTVVEKPVRFYLDKGYYFEATDAVYGKGLYFLSNNGKLYQLLKTEHLPKLPGDYTVDFPLGEAQSMSFLLSKAKEEEATQPYSSKDTPLPKFEFPKVASSWEGLRINEMPIETGVTEIDNSTKKRKEQSIKETASIVSSPNATDLILNKFLKPFLDDSIQRRFITGHWELPDPPLRACLERISELRFKLKNSCHPEEQSKLGKFSHAYLDLLNEHKLCSMGEEDSGPSFKSRFLKNTK